MVDPVAVGGALLLALPGAWLALSGLFGLRAVRRARALTPVSAAEVDPGPVTVGGPARPVAPEETLPAPDGGSALAYTYRVVRLPAGDAPLAGGETVARGTGAVPFVVGDPDGVLVGPEGTELDLDPDGETVVRFEDDPPDAVVEFLDSQGIEVAPAEGPLAVAVSAIEAGEVAYVTGVAERATEEAAPELPGEYVVRRGAGSVPFVVADDPEARGSGRHVQRGVVHLLLGAGLLVAAGLVVGL